MHPDKAAQHFLVCLGQGDDLEFGKRIDEMAV
jgi:hypothetical protein